MRRFKKILKWTGIILLLLVIVLTATVMLRQNLTYARPYPAITASADSATIARGKYIIFGPGHCADCHTTKNNDSLIDLGKEVPLSGGHLFELPVGKLYSKNITPDKETGIGNYTDAEIARALRYGVHPDGRAVFDFMPFHNVSDEDMTAIISYLRSQKPVVNKVPAHDLNVLGKVINAFLIKPVGPVGEPAVSVKPDTTAAYGEYVAISMAGCYNCHTQRDLSGQFTGEPFAGGNEIEGFITPNLTPDSSSRIFGWSKKNFVDRFRMKKVIHNSPMPWNSYRRMNDNDLEAVYHFLQTVKPVKSKPVNNIK